MMHALYPELGHFFAVFPSKCFTTHHLLFIILLQLCQLHVCQVSIFHLKFNCQLNNMTSVDQIVITTYLHMDSNNISTLRYNYKYFHYSQILQLLFLWFSVSTKYFESTFNDAIKKNGLLAIIILMN